MKRVESKFLTSDSKRFKTQVMRRVCSWSDGRKEFGLHVELVVMILFVLQANVREPYDTVGIAAKNNSYMRGIDVQAHALQGARGVELARPPRAAIVGGGGLVYSRDGALCMAENTGI